MCGFFSHLPFWPFCFPLFLFALSLCRPDFLSLSVPLSMRCTFWHGSFVYPCVSACARVRRQHNRLHLRESQLVFRPGGDVRPSAKGELREPTIRPAGRSRRRTPRKQSISPFCRCTFVQTRASSLKHTQKSLEENTLSSWNALSAYQWSGEGSDKMADITGCQSPSLFLSVCGFILLA